MAERLRAPLGASVKWLAIIDAVDADEARGATMPS